MAKFWLEIKKEANCLGALLKNVPPLLHAVDHTAGDNWFAFRKLLDLSWECEVHAEKTFKRDGYDGALRVASVLEAKYEWNKWCNTLNTCCLLYVVHWASHWLQLINLCNHL